MNLAVDGRPMMALNQVIGPLMMVYKIVEHIPVIPAMIWVHGQSDPMI